MALLNPDYSKLKAGYLFPEIGRRVSKFAAENPQAKIIRLGIGDVTEPLPAAVVTAMHKAVDELAVRSSFRGYGPEQGYDFLRQAIVDNDFKSRGCDIALDEVFVSDGSKCDTGNILEIFGDGNVVAIIDPVYPVYVDTNVMAGRTGPANESGRYEGLVYIPVTAENNFVPALPDRRVDLIYLCYPNNPTGMVASRAELQKWVDYARANDSIILFDAAYEAFITDPDIPHSIYELPGARDVAIEFRSFSKTAGFTGTRCAYTVVPKSLMAFDRSGQAHSVHALWNRRHTTKFNGVSYPVQRAAAAIFTDAGKKQVSEMTSFYLANAALIRSAMGKLGFGCVGGDNAPYIWINTGRDSWEFFDLLLNQAQVVCTPGAGFGKCGEGHVRISAFNSRENVERALERIAQALR